MDLWKSTNLIGKMHGNGCLKSRKSNKDFCYSFQLFF
jgi:hypothetical protein